jgi:hypothetical protein
MIWNSMNSAPKDGTHILVAFSKYRTEFVVTEAYWHQPGNPEKKGYWMLAFGQHLSIPVGWMEMPLAINLPASNER